MQVAAQMGWSEDRLNWTCWDDYNAMLGHLAAGDGAPRTLPAAPGYATQSPPVTPSQAVSAQRSGSLLQAYAT